MASSKNILKMENITMQFGGVVAVDNLSLEVNEGEIVSLIGPNGAGKTTAFNVVTGVYAPTNGAVWFNGNKIVENHPRRKMKKLYAGKDKTVFNGHLEPTPDKITKLGIARTFHRRSRSSCRGFHRCPQSGPVVRRGCPCHRHFPAGFHLLLVARSVVDDQQFVV